MGVPRVFWVATPPPAFRCKGALGMPRSQASVIQSRACGGVNFDWPDTLTRAAGVGIWRELQEPLHEPRTWTGATAGCALINLTESVAAMASPFANRPD